MKGSNAFLLHVSDFLLDENVAAMSLEQIGGYVVLLGFANRQGSLPADKAQIARMLKLNSAKFESLWAALSRCFVQTEIDGEPRLINPTLVRQREEYQAFKERQRVSGSRGGQARLKAKKGTTKAKAKPSLSQGQARANENDNDNETQEVEEKLRVCDVVAEEHWKRFCSYRRKRTKGGFTAEAERLNLIDLAKLKQDGYDPVAVINQTIAKGWTGLFPISGFRPTTPSKVTNSGSSYVETDADRELMERIRENSRLALERMKEEADAMDESAAEAEGIFQ
jgi:hypothetical protein